MHPSSLDVVVPSSTPLPASPTIVLRHQAAPGARLSCPICRAWPSLGAEPERAARGQGRPF